MSGDSKNVKDLTNEVSVHSFLYLHPGENPAISLVSPVLDVNNYHAWSRSMMTALSAKNKLEFIDGTTVEPSIKDATYQAWKRCNNMVVSWIVHSVSPSIRQSILWMNKAEEIWNDLKSRYFQGDLLRVSDLQMEASSIKQGDLTVTEFFTKLRVIWDELDNFRPDPTCNCKVKCPCNPISLISKRKNEDHAMQFLRGLNEQYSNIKSHVLLMDPIPSISKIFSYAVQQERQVMGNVSSNESDIKVNAANVQVSCSYCGKSGHTESTCYRKNGFPPNNDSRNSKNPANKRICSHCGRNGHTIDACYRKHGFPPGHKLYNGKSNAVKTTDVKQETVSKGDCSSTDQEMRLTPQQYQNLMALLQSSNKDGVNSEPQNSQINTVTSGSTHQGESFPIINFYRKTNLWIFDSGATDHVTCCLNNFSSYKKINPITVSLPNNAQVTATHIGSVQLNEKLLLNNVLFIPSFGYNLVSISKLLSSLDIEIVFTQDSCIVQDPHTKERIGIANTSAGLYMFDSSKNVAAFDRNCNSMNSNLWHDRLGHLSDERLAVLNQKHSYIRKHRTDNCGTCHLAKQRKLPFPNSNSYADKPFDVIHVDIWGPCAITSLHAYRYFLTIVDDHTRFTWLYLMNNKSETRKHLVNFITLVKNQFDKCVKIVRSDNGPEFNMKDFFNSEGIVHQTSCVETPEQNGIVERKHQHLMNVTRALLFRSNVPTQFWCYAVSHAVFLINRIPTPFLKNASPFEKLYNKQPDLSYIRVFGCMCYNSTLVFNRNKLDPRANASVFLGFKSNVKGYIVLDLKNHSINVSRNVVFYENYFPYSQKTNDDTNVNSSDIPLPVSENYHSIMTDIIKSPCVDIDNVDNESLSSNEAEPNIDHSTCQRESRARRPPSYLKDYHTFSAASELAKNVRYPIESYISYSKISPSFRKVISAIDSNVEPTSYEEAIKDERWNAAMNEEVQALQKNNTWTVTTLPENKVAIGCRWIYKTKYKADGTVDRFKARLVAKGYTQMEGLDYLDTFSPVAKLTTVRLLLSLTAINGWHLKQLDVNNAFLHGDLNEEVYMDLPLGMKSTKPNQVCKLHKSLYGLKQASRQWYDKLSTFLISHRFKQANADHSLFTKTKHSSITALLIYVDDIILAGNDLAEINNITNELDISFKIKNLGNLTYFLGLEVARSSKGIHLCQRKYTLDLLQETGMLASAPMPTPMKFSRRNIIENGEPLTDTTAYRRLVGKLLYLTNTRPDITHAVHQLSQHVAAPTTVHHQACLRVLRYLKQNPGHGIFLDANSEIKVKGFSDSDWAGCPETRKSVTGFIVYLGHSPIAWKSKKQSTVSRSSTEAEYRALASTTCELQWILYLLQDLQVQHPQPALLFCDNQSAMQIATNQVFHERTKHIEIDCHVIREKVQNGIIKLLPIDSKNQHADILTKALPPSSFQILCSKLGMLNIHSQLEGGSQNISNYHPPQTA